MFERFLIIINNLDAMGKHYSEEDLVRKVIRSLTKQWETKSKTVALKSKISSKEEESEEDDDVSDDEFELFTRRLRKMMKSKKKENGSSSKDNEKYQSKVICYNCGESCHYKLDYPQKKKEENNKKDKNKVRMSS
ncbi:hypothetical protein PIB30_099599 [Stylosanthes scabra]|uniref:CCHC-type domain-containing protein n=1 Tax=Stylosanthes scabra TaxID=79078 RepID=A0ABU6WVC3_9FABA|nr:hypothetical protein [Stylosanthes scabra]